MHKTDVLNAIILKLIYHDDVQKNKRCFVNVLDTNDDDYVTLMCVRVCTRDE